MGSSSVKRWWYFAPCLKISARYESGSLVWLLRVTAIDYEGLNVVLVKFLATCLA